MTDLVAEVRRELALLGPAGRPLTDDPAEVEGHLAAQAELAQKVRRLLDRCERAEVELEAHKDAGTDAFDAIAVLCGCPEWDYPGQLVRDVEALKARAEAAERRVAELEGRLEDRSNAWHDRDLRSGAETERAAIVADLREVFSDADDHPVDVDGLIGRYESGAHLGSKKGGDGGA